MFPRKIQSVPLPARLAYEGYDRPKARLPGEGGGWEWRVGGGGEEEGREKEGGREGRAEGKGERGGKCVQAVAGGQGRKGEG